MKRLIVRELSFNYGLHTILDQISFDLSARQTLALVGPSGCGKSTLLHLLAGLLPSYTGEITQPFGPLAVMFQDPRLMPWKSAETNMAIGLKAIGVPKAERIQRSNEFGLKMGLARQDLKKYPHELSGGMQSRIALARALIIQPELLLLDEPFSALDIGLKHELYALLRQHIELQQMTVVMITHDLMEAVRLADQICVMAPQPGRIIHQLAIASPHSERNNRWIYQKTAELLQNEKIQQSFFQKTNS